MFLSLITIVLINLLSVNKGCFLEMMNNIMVNYVKGKVKRKEPADFPNFMIFTPMLIFI